MDIEGTTIGTMDGTNDIEGITVGTMDGTNDMGKVLPLEPWMVLWRLLATGKAPRMVLLYRYTNLPS